MRIPPILIKVGGTEHAPVMSSAPVMAEAVPVATPPSVPIAVAQAVPVAMPQQAPTSAVTHWSGVHYGATFQITVAPTKREDEERKMTVQLRRHPTTHDGLQRARASRCTRKTSRSA